jgi:hypothetical protein
MDMPDAQIAANWAQIAQQYDAIPGNNKTPLNPQQPMTKQQLQNFGPLLSMNGAYLDQELARRKAAGDATKAETTAPPSVEAQSMADWLASRPVAQPRIHGCDYPEGSAT